MLDFITLAFWLVLIYGRSLTRGCLFIDLTVRRTEMWVCQVARFTTHPYFVRQLPTTCDMLHFIS